LHCLFSAASQGDLTATANLKTILFGIDGSNIAADAGGFGFGFAFGFRFCFGF
jgi:hypothetical protein